MDIIQTTEHDNFNRLLSSFNVTKCINLGFLYYQLQRQLFFQFLTLAFQARFNPFIRQEFV